MKLYHRTPHPEAILRDGFRDPRGSLNLTGVWLSDVPLDENEGAKGPTVLSVKIPVEERVDLEVVEVGKPYREWCLPSDLVNRFGPPSVVDDDYAGSTEEAVLLRVKRLRATGGSRNIAEADELEAHLPFLRAHGLLASDGEEV